MKLSLGHFGVASHDRDGGMFVGAAVVWFGNSYRMQDNVRSCRADNLEVTKGGEISRFTCRLAIQSLAQRPVRCATRDRNVGSASAAALQSGVQLWDISGHPSDEGASKNPNPIDPLLNVESPRQALQPCHIPTEAEMRERERESKSNWGSKPGSLK